MCRAAADPALAGANVGRCTWPAARRAAAAGHLAGAAGQERPATLRAWVTARQPRAAAVPKK
jgi:hypothetical protein